jgi:hypothetical protein
MMWWIKRKYIALRVRLLLFEANLYRTFFLIGRADAAFSAADALILEYDLTSQEVE